jgi:uncharacterized sulfatase
VSFRTRVATLLLALGCAAEPVGPPNLVLVIGDDHGFPDFGFMGSETVRTPRLDRLAEQGVVFPTGYSTASLCRPALRTLLTGLEPIQYDQLQREARGSDVPLIRSLDTLPRLLAERGYMSFQAGKYAEGDYEGGGFSEGMVEGKRGLEQAARLARETLEPVFDFLSRSGERPFFLWFAPLLPHIPHDAPERYLALYEGAELTASARRYYASISWLDEAVGRLVDHIDELGLARRTLIV